MFSQEWQEKIDEGLRQDSTIAYLWQQKAMPLFKQKKYELGMRFLDEAVALDPKKYLDYRAFIKCIFVKTYVEAIKDFEECKKMLGYGYIMDHSYDFYIAICYLQLNEFKIAEQILNQDIEYIKNKQGETWVHFLDLFYLGIIKYEQKKYEEAIIIFDTSLNQYKQFSDAKYYKAKALDYLGKFEEASILIKEAKNDFEEGYTINEDNVLYEVYPYQVNWKLVQFK